MGLTLAAHNMSAVVESRLDDHFVVQPKPKPEYSHHFDMAVTSQLIVFVFVLVVASHPPGFGQDVGHKNEVEALGSQEDSHSYEGAVARKAHTLAAADHFDWDGTLDSDMEEHPWDLVDIGRAAAVVDVVHTACSPVEVEMIECRLALVGPCHSWVHQP